VTRVRDSRPTSAALGAVLWSRDVLRDLVKPVVKDLLVGNTSFVEDAAVEPVREMPELSSKVKAPDGLKEDVPVLVRLPARRGLLAMDLPAVIGRLHCGFPGSLRPITDAEEVVRAVSLAGLLPSKCQEVFRDLRKVSRARVGDAHAAAAGPPPK
jgi:hypothetical protein